MFACFYVFFKATKLLGYFIDGYSLAKCSLEEQRAVIRFLSAKGVKPNEECLFNIALVV